ncbi:MAG: hypothetical protein QW594_03775, partial [Candidatus Woesearchaeota archaeon]
DKSIDPAIKKYIESKNADDYEMAEYILLDPNNPKDSGDKYVYNKRTKQLEKVQNDDGKTYKSPNTQQLLRSLEQTTSGGTANKVKKEGSGDLDKSGSTSSTKDDPKRVGTINGKSYTQYSDGRVVITDKDGKILTYEPKTLLIREVDGNPIKGYVVKDGQTTYFVSERGVRWEYDPKKGEIVGEATSFSSSAHKDVLIELSKNPIEQKKVNDIIYHKGPDGSLLINDNVYTKSFAQIDGKTYDGYFTKSGNTEYFIDISGNRWKKGSDGKYVRDGVSQYQEIIKAENQELIKEFPRNLVQTTKVDNPKVDTTTNQPPPTKYTIEYLTKKYDVPNLQLEKSVYKGVEFNPQTAETSITTPWYKNDIKVSWAYDQQQNKVVAIINDEKRIDPAYLHTYRTFSGVDYKLQDIIHLTYIENEALITQKAKERPLITLNPRLMPQPTLPTGTTTTTTTTQRP